METIQVWWSRTEQRYTYRIPTAALTVAALLVATGLWAVADGRGPVEQDRAASGAIAPGYVAPDGGASSETLLPGVDEAPGSSGGSGASPTRTGASDSGGRAGGGGGGQAATLAAACPDGLDKGGCTGITDKTIRIGTHAAESQCGVPLPDTSDPSEAGAGDWLRYVNQVEGGIHGRKLELYEADDGYCPEMAGTAATQLIDENRVFAAEGFLGVDQSRVVAEKANSRGVPYLSGGGPQEWAARWRVFHQNQSSYDVMYPALLRYIVGRQGLNKPKAVIGVMYVDTPDVRDPTKRSFKAVPAANVKVAIPLSQGIKSNFLEEIRQMQAAGVDTVYCNCHPLNMVAFVQQADAQLFRPQYTFVSQGADLDLLLRLFPADSTWTANAKGLSNLCHQTHPCSKPYEAKLKQVNPDATLSQLSIVGIHAIEMFAEPMRRAGRDLNRTRFMQALQGLDGWTTGLTGPIHLSPDRSTGALGLAVYHSPGTGAQHYQMISVGGQAFRLDWS